ncbi:uncharacterized protein CMC5_076980 [Chondromyces crocatus]|uniref:Uncharacterized protein n=2 Tax=Chondromyces crocatus TaxID=52 RepID=A0A0K1ERJ7_CHOCO|nr:uncharacterized protein CMC5_076980 [Chondromyces crocatus]
MVSQSFIGRDIFSAIWGLVILSAAAEHLEDLRLPFDPQLQQFAAKHDRSLSALWHAVQAYACLNDAVMTISIEDSPWFDPESTFYEFEMLKAWLVLGSLESQRFREEGVVERLTFDHENIRRTCTDLLAKLLDSLLSGHWAFCVDGRSGTEPLTDATRRLQEVFQHLTPILESVRFPSNAPFTIAFSTWLPTWSADDVFPEAQSYAVYIDAWIEHMRTARP